MIKPGHIRRQAWKNGAFFYNCEHFTLVKKEPEQGHQKTGPCNFALTGISDKFEIMMLLPAMK